jgi:hypothetical protein
MSATAAPNHHIELNKLFEPDELAPAQFYATTRRTFHADPELRLMAACLEDAVATLTTDQRRCSRRQRREFNEAMRWIIDASDDDWVFSFVNVCESLGLDPAFLRAGLIRRVNQLGDAPASVTHGKGRYLSARRKVVRMRVG